MVNSYVPEIKNLFDLSNFQHSAVFEGLKYPWDILKKDLKNSYIRKVIEPNSTAIPRKDAMVTQTTVIYRGETIHEDFDIKRGSAGKGALRIYLNGKLLEKASIIFAGAYLVGNEIEIGKGCLIEEGAYVAGPIILGDMTEIRPHAYLRGEIITGKRCVVGHTSEIKSSILLNDAKAPHFAYVGDSVLGNGVNLGAGTKISNLKITGDEISLNAAGKTINTGLRKFGALIGDNVETGCNSVLNPGVVLGKRCLIYPCVSVRKGIYPDKSLVRLTGVSKLR